MKFAIKMCDSIELLISKQVTDTMKLCMQMILAKAKKYGKAIKLRLDGQFKLEGNIFDQES